jgi:hypothetical protein
MQGRKVVVVCNLKPVKMRGIKSSAMVLAASPRLKEGEEDHHAGPVELVTPPADGKAGERVFFEGWKGEPEGVLNPKKKVSVNFSEQNCPFWKLSGSRDTCRLRRLASFSLPTLLPIYSR